MHARERQIVAFLHKSRDILTVEYDKPYKQSLANFISCREAEVSSFVSPFLVQASGHFGIDFASLHTRFSRGSLARGFHEVHLLGISHVSLKRQDLKTNLAFKRFEYPTIPFPQQFNLQERLKPEVSWQDTQRSRIRLPFGRLAVVNFNKNFKAHLRVKTRTLYVNEKVDTCKLYLRLKIPDLLRFCFKI